MKKNIKVSIIIYIVFSILLINNSYSSTSKYRLKNTKKDTVLFVGYVKLIDRTEELKFPIKNSKGFALIDPNDIKKTKAEFYIDVLSVETGQEFVNQGVIDLLEGKKHPKASFKLKSILTDIKNIKANVPTTIKVNGNFEAHGITKNVDTYIELTHIKEKGEFRIRSLIKLNIDDFEVSNMGLIEKVISIYIDVYTSRY